MSPQPPLRGIRPPSLRAGLAGAAMLAALPAGAVVGGREAGEAPEARSSVMVLNARGGACTGVVVAREAVLTAGHCVAGAAETRIHFRGADGSPVLVPVAARAVHPEYRADAIRARARSVDLALLRAAEPLPARFEAAALNPARPGPGAALTLGGFGPSAPGDHRSAGRFRLADLPVIEPYGASRILVWLKAAGAGGCTGDSGGPIADADGVLALAAWVEDACGGLTQGVLLGPQRGWIDATLGRWSLAARWAR